MLSAVSCLLSISLHTTPFETNTSHQLTSSTSPCLNRNPFSISMPTNTTPISPQDRKVHRCGKSMRMAFRTTSLERSFVDNPSKRPMKSECAITRRLPIRLSSGTLRTHTVTKRITHRRAEAGRERVRWSVLEVGAIDSFVQ